MTTDHNEAMRLADELVAPIGTQTSYQTAHEAAALIRQQATARALDTFAHNVMAAQARLEMVQLTNKLRNVEGQRDTLRAEVERLRVDAERYEWLRSAHWSDAPLCCVLEPKANVRLGATCPSGDQLDTAIDTARKATQ